MESKLVIFVLFATLGQSLCSDQSSKDFSFLSTEALHKYVQIEEYQALTIKSKIESFNTVFEIIRDAAIEHTTGLTTTSDYDGVSRLAKSLRQIKDAVDYSMSAVLVAAGRTTCDAVETARTDCYRDLENIYANVTEALEFVQSSEFTDEACTKLEAYRTVVQADFKNIVKVIADSVRSCAGVTSQEGLAMVQTSEDGMDLALRGGSNDLFDVIRHYWHALATGSSSMRVVHKIEQKMRNADVRFTTDVVNKFSMLKTLVVSSYLNKTGAMSSLNRQQRANTAATYSFNASVEMLFENIIGHMVAQGIGASHGAEDFSVIDESEIYEAAEKWMTGTSQILSAIDSVGTAEDQLNDNTKLVASRFIEQLKIALGASTSSNAVSEIEALGRENDAKAEEYVKAIFDLLISGRRLTRSTRSEIRTYRSQATSQLKVFTSGLAKAYEIVAESRSEGSKNVSERIVSLNDLEVEIVKATGNVVDIIYAVGVTVLIDHQTLGYGLY